MKDIHTYKNYYFIGIGGIGMSALARYFKFSNATVYGYDKTPTKLTHNLEKENISIIYEDTISLLPKNISKEDTVVIYTPAIPENLKIKHYFIENGFTLFKRSQVLGEITKSTLCLAIAGTHGKTTTSTLLGHICKYANLPATAFLGGISANYNSNFIYNGSKISIVEADEFDRSFLSLSPNMAAITSTDSDHLDIYGNHENIIESFNQFADLIPENGFLIVKKGLPINAKHLTYSANEKADYYAENIQIINGQFHFDLVTPHQIIKDFIVPIPGKHNVENAIAALAISLQLGIEADILRKALVDFKGVLRRFNKHVFENNKIYIDDYAHHPTEINAVIDTIRNLYPTKKLLTVFQPHLYSRTADFAEDFAKSLSKTDTLILLDIYPARETPIEGITSEWLADKIQLDDKEICSIDNVLKSIKTKDFDVLLTIGAGNIDTLYDPIINWLNEIKI
ncbi:UDP-N-acetylmuramate--L-alanine ligase [Apibacter sp. wkB309]|uniref:UDP-N-acetylmuramate--L-alanine ligase n=1 Tax=Apibacter sp. wkB309 TaxID=1679467 RepID=UPI000CF987C9|nr:UDP-N-acetylmuramate--L-alanine ligase [Apibacter sp. wkB309]PQL91316.1 UDP-N-acetylmuramate--L-alanine ligase [Apibacter sp. wkB309]